MQTIDSKYRGDRRVRRWKNMNAEDYLRFKQFQVITGKASKRREFWDKFKATHPRKEGN